MNSKVKSKFKTHKKKFHNTSAHIKLLIQSEAKMPSHFLSSQWELAVAEAVGRQRQVQSFLRRATQNAKMAEAILGCDWLSLNLLLPRGSGQGRAEQHQWAEFLK